MKKILFTAIAGFCMLSASAQVPALSLGAVKANPGETVEAKIYLNNELDVNSIAFTAYLPQGFSVALNGSGKFADGVSGELSDRASGFGALVNSGSFAKMTSGTWNGYNRVKWTLGGDDGEFIEPGTGAIYTFNLVVDASVAAGVYPVYMVDNKATNSKAGAAGFSKKSYTSYIVVGNPTNGSLEVKGILPDFLDEDLAKETAIKSLDLTGLTAVDGTFTYLAGRSVTAPSAAVSAKIAYAAAPAAGNTYASFKAPVAGAMDCYKFDKPTGSIAVFKPATSVEVDDCVLVDKYVSVAGVAGQIVATPANGTITTGCYLKNDEMHTVSGNATLPYLRGSWAIAAGSNLRVVIDEPLTGINAIQNEATEATFDLQGRQTVNAKNGVYVVNGKKQIVK